MNKKIMNMLLLTGILTSSQVFAQDIHQEREKIHLLKEQLKKEHQNEKLLRQEIRQEKQKEHEIRKARMEQRRLKHLENRN
jgi:uncharacterized membrane protein